MKKHLQKTLLFLVLLFFSNRLMADGTATVNGVPITTTEDETSSSRILYAVRFDSYTLGTSNAYIYNNAGGTSSSAGCLKVRGMTGKTVQLEITNMKEPGTNTIGIFMANGTTTPTLWALIYEAVYNGTITASGTQTGSIPITEMHDYCRLGIKREGNNSADFTIKETYTRPLR